MISRTACIKHSQAFQQAYGYQQYSLTDLVHQAMWASKQPFESNPKEAAASDRWEKPNTVLSIHPAPLIIIFKTQFQNLIANQWVILKQNLCFPVFSLSPLLPIGQNAFWEDEFLQHILLCAISITNKLLYHAFLHVITNIIISTFLEKKEIKKIMFKQFTDEGKCTDTPNLRIAVKM